MEEIKTLFISGFPVDATEREIYLLFRPCVGYVGSTLQTTKKGPPVCFAVFDCQASAVMAMHSLADVRFDPDAKYPLRVEMAKANSKPKRSRSIEGDDPSTSRGFRNTSNDYNLNLMNPAYPNQNIQPPFPGQLFGGPDLLSSYDPTNLAPAHSMIPNPQMQNTGMQSTGYHWPTPPPGACTTLFIAGLQPGCTEKELLDLFQGLPGFVKLKMVTKAGGRPPVAWAEFQSINHSTAACNSINTLVQANPNQFGIRVEFAKAKMGSAPAKSRSGKLGGDGGVDDVEGEEGE